MCGCKDCKEITLLGGLDGVGIASVILNVDNSLTFNYTNGNTYTTTSLNAANPYFYQEALVPINVATKVNPTVYTRPEIGAGAPYLNLVYTNTTGAAKTFAVTGSFDMGTVPATGNIANIANAVDGALVKTVVSTDSVLYESTHSNLVSGYLFWGAGANNIITAGSTPHFLEDVLGSKVEFRFLNTSIQDNAAIFKIVTLQPNEKVSLMFKTKDADTPGWIKSAQLMVVGL
jgi:hypothetical protein